MSTYERMKKEREGWQTVHVRVYKELEKGELVKVGDRFYVVVVGESGLAWLEEEDR